MKKLTLILFTIFYFSCSNEEDHCSSQPVDETFCDCIEWNFENTPNSIVEELEREFINDYLNPYRLGLGKKELILNDTISIAAQRHANDMVNRNYFSHDTQTCDWGPLQRSLNAGTRGNGENIARGYRSAERMFEAWRTSEGHNRNMTASYTRTGIGLAYTKNGQPYWVNVFR